MKSHLLTLVSQAFLAIGTQLSAQTFGIQYGPRAFSTAPVGTKALDLKYENLHAGINFNGFVLKGFDMEVNTAIVSYNTYFDLFGRTANITAALPYVWMDGELNTVGGILPAFSESGFTDPYFQFTLPLIGGEATAGREFMEKEPGWLVSAMMATRAPIGEYDSSKPANPGANRWEGRVAMPVSYTIGTPTRQTSFEFVPMMYFFGDNSDGFGGVDISQDAFYQLEGHITHDFNQMLWGSLNVLYGVGGETSVDGVDQSDSIEYTSMGVTVGARLSRHMSVNASYSERVSSKSDANDGSLFRFSLTWVL